jgi:hypothetical protein
METVCSSETLVSAVQSVWCYYPEDHHRHFNRSENLKSQHTRAKFIYNFRSDVNNESLELGLWSFIWIHIHHESTYKWWLKRFLCISVTSIGFLGYIWRLKQYQYVLLETLHRNGTLNCIIIKISSCWLYDTDARVLRKAGIISSSQNFLKCIDWTRSWYGQMLGFFVHCYEVWGHVTAWNFLIWLTINYSSMTHWPHHVVTVVGTKPCIPRSLEVRGKGI